MKQTVDVNKARYENKQQCRYMIGKLKVVLRKLFKQEISIPYCKKLLPNTERTNIGVRYVLSKTTI